MSTRVHVATVVAALGLFMGSDLLACGDKFLSSGRGTRYQRPKNARAASILIYAAPSTELPSDDRMQAALRHGGHRATTVRTLEQLSAILQGGRFDVVLAGSTSAGAVQQLLGNAPDAAVVLALDSASKERSLLRAIDKAVEQRDRSLKKAHSRT
jgi:hypothetical protein